MTATNTIDGMPLAMLSRPEHMERLLDATFPYLLINKYFDSDEASSLAPTHKLAQVSFNPRVIRDFCNSETMAVPIKKSHRNISSLVTLGRSEKCDIVVTRKEISKRHCGFYTIDGHWFVLDLESTNGMAVNGSRATRGNLSSQSIIALGDQVTMAFISAVDLGFLAAEIKTF